MRRVIFGILLLLLFGLLVGNRFFMAKLGFVSFLNDPSKDEETKVALLIKENQNLKFQLLNQKVKKTDSFKVYSNYPFSNRGELTIDAGKNEGLEVGDVVTYGNSVLVGKVIKVYEKVSLVMTVYHPEWKSTVRVGEREVDALLKGGNELTLTLIPKEAELTEGELVVAASPDLPYGLGIGAIREIRSASGGAFKEATLEPSFQLKDLKDVSVYR